MHKILRKAIYFGILPLLLLISVNYFGDAGKLFSSKYEENISDGLLAGQNITNIFNFDERLVVKNMITGSPSAPDVLILGSSHTLLLNRKYFTGKTVFNASVSMASIQDMAAIFEIFRQKHERADQVFIALDPWTLNETSGGEQWQTLEKEWARFSQSANIQIQTNPSLHISKLVNLVSPSYFQSSLKTLLMGINDPLITIDTLNTTLTKFPDGSITYGTEMRKASVNEISAKAITFAREPIPSMETFTTISPYLLNALEKLLTAFLKDNVKVTIFLSPYHPDAHSILSPLEKYKMVEESEKVFRSLAQNYNIEIIGSYNPNKVNTSREMFYDGFHLNEKGLHFLLDSIN